MLANAYVQTTLHALRRSRALTLVELARLTGISTRRLAEFDYGDRLPEASEREALATVLGPAAWSAAGGIAATARRPKTARRIPLRAVRAAKWTAAAAAGLALVLGTPLSASAATPTASIASAQVEAAAETPQRWVASPGLNLRQGPGIVNPVTLVLSRGSEVVMQGEAQQVGQSNWVKVQTGQNEGWVNDRYLTADQASTQQPPAAEAAVQETAADEAAPLTAQAAVRPARPGQLSCPVDAHGRQIVMTQGYGVGTHAPAATWGAIDLAPAGGAQDTLIVAAHAGTVQVALNTWPAGNHIWVNGADGWRTGYSHMQAVYVQSGQYVEAGQPIGLMGSTGVATGPHLDFQVWHNGVNVDPTPMVDCS